MLGRCVSCTFKRLICENQLSKLFRRRYYLNSFHNAAEKPAHNEPEQCFANNIRKLVNVHGTDKEACNSALDIFLSDMMVVENFVTPKEERELMIEVERSFRRQKYQFDHWDGAIVGFRETEKTNWNDGNKLIVDKIRRCSFKSETALNAVHVLDLSEDGWINPHVDSVRFSGNVVSGISLLSTAIMRFRRDKSKWVIEDQQGIMITNHLWLNVFIILFTSSEYLGRRICDGRCKTSTTLSLPNRRSNAFQLHARGSSKDFVSLEGRACFSREARVCYLERSTTKHQHVINHDKLVK